MEVEVGVAIAPLLRSVDQDLSPPDRPHPSAAVASSQEAVATHPVVVALNQDLQEECLQGVTSEVEEELIAHLVFMLTVTGK